MTPAQAIAVKALWDTLGENGNILAASWSKLLADVSPEDLIKIAERLASKLPKLYADTAELIAGTGHILDPRAPEPDNTLIDDILGWEPPDAD